MSASQNKFAPVLDLLHDREVEKLRKLAVACGEDFNQKFLVTALKNLLKVVPNSIQDRHFVSAEIQGLIKDIKRDDKYITLTLKDGSVLRTFPSRQQYRNYYYCFRHKLPQNFSPESYQACNDLGFRYKTGERTIRDALRIGFIKEAENRNIIECGAYNGWKALGFAKHLGKSGKIIVIEIDDEQFKLAKLNLESNLPSENFIVLNTGVWHSFEERAYSFEHYASHTLKTPDERQHHTQEKTISTTTLDNIIDGSGVDVIDFMNVQTGGSELESVQGLVRNLDRVKLMWLGTHYAHDGISIRYRCIDYLLGQGCRIYGGGKEITSTAGVDKAEVGGIWAVSPAFKDSIVPQLK